MNIVCMYNIRKRSFFVLNLFLFDINILFSNHVIKLTEFIDLI
jgi:hypothetical protein